MGNFYFSNSCIETNQLIDSVKQLSGFYTNMFLPKRNFCKKFSRTVSGHKTSLEHLVINLFYQKCFCNFTSTIIILKSTTDDLKASLAIIWVFFAATVLEKVVVLVSTTVINYSPRDTTYAFTNIII